MKARWPTLPNGSVDWLTVFQHPETGLMVNVVRADSTEKLKACMQVIITALFSRDGDVDVRKSFLASIDALFSRKGQLLAKKTKIKVLLSHIMYDREARARLYVEQQAKQGDASEHRLRQDDPLQVLKDI